MNVLCIITGPLPPEALSSGKPSRAQAPNLERLAAESACFESAYTPQPARDPARAALLTGLHPHETGCIRNGMPLAPGVVCLPEWPGIESWTAGYAGRGFPCSDSTRIRGLPDRGETAALESCRSSDAIEAREIAETTASFVLEHQDEPFILYADFGGTSRAGASPAAGSPEGPESAGPPDSAGLPPSRRTPAGSFEEIPPHSDPAFQIRTLDEQIGVLLDALENCGLLDSTWIVLVGDRGDTRRAHRLLGVRTLAEDCIRVPWFLCGPGLPPGRRVSVPVSTVDLAPTLGALLGASAPAAVSGKSVQPLLSADAAGFIPSPVVVQDRRSPGGPAAAPCADWAVITPDHWKYVRLGTGKEQLFHLARDPWELENLAAAPGRPRNRLESLRRFLEVWRKDHPGRPAPAPPPERARIEPD